MTEFAGLNAKAYSYKVENNDGSTVSKAKKIKDVNKVLQKN